MRPIEIEKLQIIFESFYLDYITTNLKNNFVKELKKLANEDYKPENSNTNFFPHFLKGNKGRVKFVVNRKKKRILVGYTEIKKIDLMTEIIEEEIETKWIFSYTYDNKVLKFNSKIKHDDLRKFHYMASVSLNKLYIEDCLFEYNLQNGNNSLDILFNLYKGNKIDLGFIVFNKK